ncbi:kinase-like protein [Lentinula edodes]|uniref:Kinase-like protein n=1 Tax=Lentinula edodes TaxID=5353 RepID=A0A1Q3E0G4_LENED|nr:kinase-like protein [Lentinula edodes]
MQPAATDPFAPSAAAIEEVFEQFEQAKTTPLQMCVDLGDGRFVKCRFASLRQEAEALQFVRANTTIPVPSVLLVFQREDKWYLVMETIGGTTLSLHCKNMSTTQLVEIANTLKEYMYQLENLGAHRCIMGSWLKGPFSNVFFALARHYRFKVPLPTDEYNNMADFHRYWVQRLGDHPQCDFLRDALSKEVLSEDKVVLSHGDLNVSNIMVSADGHILSVLDWDTFGWYPAFWEPMSMWRGGRWRTQWLDALETVFKQTDMGTTYITVLDFLGTDYFTSDDLDDLL